MRSTVNLLLGCKLVVLSYTYSSFYLFSVYTNFTGKTKCFDIGLQADQSLGDLGWDFQVRRNVSTDKCATFINFVFIYLQACSEMVMPICSDNVNDMFEFQPWSLPKYTSKCESKWGVTPR